MRAQLSNLQDDDDHSNPESEFSGKTSVADASGKLRSILSSAKGFTIPFANRFSLSTKLIGGFLSFTVWLIVVCAMSWFTVRTVSNRYEYFYRESTEHSDVLRDMKSATHEYTSIVYELALPHSNSEDFVEIEKAMNKAEKSYGERILKLQKSTTAPADEKILGLLQKNWDTVTHAGEQILSLAKKETQDDRTQLLQVLGGEFNPDSIRAVQEIQDSIDKEVAQEVKSLESARKAASLGQTLLLIIVVVTSVFSLALAFILSRWLTGQLVQVATRLQGSGKQVTSSSSDFSKAASELSSGVTQQAAALQETVASLDEVSAMIMKNADNAKKSLEVARLNQENADGGKQSVASMIHAIEEINVSNSEIMTQVEASNREISDIVKVITEIGNKTKVINDIVFQTKLLSFNASVEAARAGEHGKGFAVVAEEIGNLAQMSGTAAKEISEMIGTSLEQVERIVKDTKTKVERLITSGKEKVNTGTTVANQCGNALDQIVKNVGDVNILIEEIAVASQEQAQGISEINKAMNQLDQVTHQNATASEQSARTSEDLSKESQELDSLVQSLLEIIHGEKV